MVGRRRRHRKNEPWQNLNVFIKRVGQDTFRGSSESCYKGNYMGTVVRIGQDTFKSSSESCYKGC